MSENTLFTNLLTFIKSLKEMLNDLTTRQKNNETEIVECKNQNIFLVDALLINKELLTRMENKISNIEKKLEL